MPHSLGNLILYVWQQHHIVSQCFGHRFVMTLYKMPVSIIIKTFLNKRIAGMSAETVGRKVAFCHAVLKMNGIFSTYKSVTIKKGIKTFVKHHIRVNVYSAISMNSVEPYIISRIGPLLMRQSFVHKYGTDPGRRSRVP